MSRTATTAWRRIARTIREQGQNNNTPCHLCHGARGPIDYRTQTQANQDAQQDGHYWLINAPRPLAFAADHIIPHAAGGADSLDNAAPSHKVCNESAGAKQTPIRRTPKQKATQGFWIPNNRETDPLPGHALPGTRTATHTFQTAPQGGGGSKPNHTATRGPVHTPVAFGPPIDDLRGKDDE